MKRTVLVADDSASMRNMVAYALTAAGFDVRQAVDGRQGLAQAETAAIDLVITDLNMPVMDGLAFIRELRALPRYRFTPILMLTTESQDAMRSQGKAAGATGWLVKPFNPQQLLDVVSKVLR